MKRLTFLAGLLGLPLLGQKRKQVDPYRIVCGQNLGERPFCAELDEHNNVIPETVEFQKPSLDAHTLGWQSGKALNNQCPVCGTMAEPVEPYVGIDGRGRVERIQSEIFVRCKRCNAAFWQDTED